MSRSKTMAQLLRMARLAERTEKTGESAQEVIEKDSLQNAGRRRFNQAALAGTALSAAPVAWAGGSKLGDVITNWRGTSGGVAVIGAGIAGLSCATELARKGIRARVFEASNRVGGRVYSLRNFFPGQVVERGAEFINSSHHVMLGYARELGLSLEDYSQYLGSVYYQFGGRSYSEAQVLEEYTAFAESIREDLQVLNCPSADRFSESDATFDFMSVDDYLQLHGAGDSLRKMIGAAYRAEFGAGIDELSAISFLRFVYSDKRSKFSSFGAFSGQYLRVAEGNDRITSGLAERLPSPVNFAHKLIAVRRLANGRLRLTFDAVGKSIQNDFDAVVLAMPFNVLRDVHLDASLQLPDWKRTAINTATMGDNSKIMVGFKQPYWYTQHERNGTGFTDASRLQSTWEANPSQSNESRAVLAGYLGGSRARMMNKYALNNDANAFIDELENIMPGANKAAVRSARGRVLAFTENWSINSLSKGSSITNRPGYFTTNAHNEAKPVGNLLFAGDHTSSFYEWQGFMEGAALSGLRAAAEAMNVVAPA